MAENGWMLEVVKGRQAGRSYALKGAETVLGNALAGRPGIDLADQESDSPRRMAAQQAVVASSPTGLAVRDLDSPGGTFVNRQRVLPGQSLPLRAGDVIQLGGVQLRVVAGANGQPPASPTKSRTAPPSSPFVLKNGTACRSWDDFLRVAAQRWGDLRDELTSNRLTVWLTTVGRPDLIVHRPPDATDDEHLDAWLARLPTTLPARPELDVHPSRLVIRVTPGGGTLARSVQIANVGHRLLHVRAEIEPAGVAWVRVAAPFAGQTHAVVEATDVPLDVDIPETLPAPLRATLRLDGDGGSKTVELVLEARKAPEPLATAPARVGPGPLDRLAGVAPVTRLVAYPLLGAVLRLAVAVAGGLGVADAASPGLLGPAALFASVAAIVAAVVAGRARDRGGRFRRGLGRDRGDRGGLGRRRGLPVFRADPRRLGDIPDRHRAALGPARRSEGRGLARDRPLSEAGRGDRPMIGLVLLAAATLADAPAPAAGDAPRVIVTQPDESKFPDINVYFELRRPDGSFIRDARVDDFRVTEDGRDRPILAFEAPITVSSKPTTLVLVVDRSGSMAQGGKIRGLKAAVRTFLDGLPEGSRVAVVAFGSEVELVCPFTTDKRRVQAAVDELRPFGGTRFFDAVDEAVKLLEGQSGRRAVLALTDGKDDGSVNAIDVPIDEARRLSVPVHTLGLGEGDEIDSESLDRVASETRGQTYRARDAEALKAIYQELAERLGSTYSLTYQTDRKIPDGTLRPIRISYSLAPAASAGETAVFIPGMVVPAPGWPGLFLVLVAVLGGLVFLPHLGRRAVDPGLLRDVAVVPT